MTSKSVQRFSEQIMLDKKPKAQRMRSVARAAKSQRQRNRRHARHQADLREARSGDFLESKGLIWRPASGDDAGTMMLWLTYQAHRLLAEVNQKGS